MTGTMRSTNPDAARRSIAWAITAFPPIWRYCFGPLDPDRMPRPAATTNATTSADESLLTQRLALVPALPAKNGRAAGRERRCQYEEITVVGVSLKKKNK